MRNVRTAVVGCGYWGKNLVRNFATLSDLRLCCDTSETVRNRIGEMHPHVRLTDSFQEVVSDEDIDAVVISTPAGMHAEMAITALEAGKHVFVEKPIALNTADAIRVARKAEEVERILMVGHLLEYHPAVEHLKRLVDSGELGDIYYCYSQRVNLGKVRFDENALLSLAPHDISVVLYLMEEEPQEVYATGQAFLQREIEDVVFLTLVFKSGRMAHIHVSWLDPHKERKLTIVGTKKMAVFDDMQSREKVRIYDKGVDRRPEQALEYASYGEALSLREGNITIPSISNVEPLSIECTEFLRSVLTGLPPRSDGWDGVRVVRVLEEAGRQIRTGTFRFQAAAV